jgi:energy-coupling factor transporter ATP-binding protein EcfA2
MSLGDFLRRNARTPLSDHYSLGGVPCDITTNSEPILDAAFECFGRIDSLSVEPTLSMRFWVDLKGTTRPPWPKPFFRGKGNLVFAGFDSESSVLIDLRNRRAIGRFSPVMGADRSHWKSVILPVLVSIMGGSVGITEIHCGCVATEGSGLLLAGPSGSGKSTLALAITRAGLKYVSDDRTFCSDQDGRLITWGLPTALKLRPPSAAFFRELCGRNPNVAPNGERAFLIDSDSQPAVNRIQHCEPRWLVFLDRQQEAGFDLMPISSAEAASRLEQGMMAETPEVASLQRKTIVNLATLPCWRLAYGGRPQSVAQELVRRFENGKNRTFHYRRKEKSSERKLLLFNPERQDPLRRFNHTPLVSNLPVMGRTVRLETNSSLVLDRGRTVFARYENASHAQPEFLWRIVCEDELQKSSHWPLISAFSDSGLRFANIGQRSFLAVDLETRVAAGYVARNLIEDEDAFVSPFLTTLFCMTVGALRLTPLAAACVTNDEKALLVLGMPNNGKTTSSYLASKLGLEFYSDRAVFLDLAQDGLRAWADFAPAAFRMETSGFLPELLSLGRPFHYLDLAFLYVEASTSIPSNGDPVIPFSCVFLERGAAKKARLTCLSPAESYRRLKQYLPFEDDECFEVQHSATLSALAHLPAHVLAYGDDPAEAAIFFPRLLTNSHLVDANP